MRWLQRIAVLIGFCACLAPMAHVMEMPNKLRLDGALWLLIQQHLYNGWGPFIGAPTEIGGLLISLILLAAGRRRRLSALAAAAYGGMLLSFFLLNAPVNEAVNHWTPATLPADWPGYRLRWETGHTLAAIFALIALAAAMSATFTQETSHPAADD